MKNHFILQKHGLHYLDSPLRNQTNYFLCGKLHVHFTFRQNSSCRVCVSIIGKNNTRIYAFIIAGGPRSDVITALV